MSVPRWHIGTGTFEDCLFWFPHNSAHMMHSYVTVTLCLGIPKIPLKYVCVNEPMRHTHLKKRNGLYPAGVLRCCSERATGQGGGTRNFESLKLCVAVLLGQICPKG